MFSILFLIIVLVLAPGQADSAYPVYRWEDTGAATYELYVTEGVPNLVSPALWLTDISGVCGNLICVLQPDSPRAMGSYAYYVRESGGQWSAPFMFDVNPPAPDEISIMVIPHQGRPEIEWPQKQHALWYQLWIEGLPTQWYEGVNICSEDICRVTPDVNLVNGQYDIAVQPWGAGGFGQWSFAMVIYNNPIPEITSFRGGGDIITISFRAARGATWYQVWLGTQYFQTPYFYQWQWGTFFGCEDYGQCVVPIEGLPSGVPLSLFVRGYGTGGMGVWQQYDFSLS